MTNEVLEGPGAVLGLPLPATTTAGRVNEVAKTIVFWTFMFVGLVLPPVLGIAGIIMNG